MATIQQLQSLSTLYSTFSKDDSLEATVARERIVHLMERTEQIIKDRAYLRDERRLLRMTTATIDNRKASLATMRRSDWLPASIVSEQSKSELDRLVVDVGGVRFEVPHEIARRDTGSLLYNWTSAIASIKADNSARPEGAHAGAALSYTASNNSYRIVTERIGYLSKNTATRQSSSSSEAASATGNSDSKIIYVVQIDRDWWLFRYIVIFLRDGRLPDDRSILSQLYREAAFYHLSELQRAIEDQKLHLRTSADAAEGDKWWKLLPSWLDKVEEQKAAASSAAAAENKPSGADNASSDWWKDTSYKGKAFLPLSSDPEKVVANAGDSDALPVSTITWSRDLSSKDSSNNNNSSSSIGRSISSQFLRGGYSSSKSNM